MRTAPIPAARASLCAAAVGAALLAAPTVASATDARPAATEAQVAAAQTAAYTPTIRWTTCENPGLDARGAQCADVKVPLDHANPDGRTITIAISRIRHTVPQSRYQGVVLVNPGGPGGSGLTLSTLGSAVPKKAGAAYDWIGFDPRGVGDSSPSVSCDRDYPGYDRPRYVPETRAIEQDWFARTNAYTARCDVLGGPILDHLTTRDVAKDMDLIRKGLGEKQINYYGFSYGTYLGQVYSTLFPTKIRRTVFDGTVDPSKVWYAGNLAQDEPFDRNINRWFAWIAQHDDVYHLGSTRAKVNKTFYATQEALYDEPAKGDGGDLGGSEWSDAYLSAGYAEFLWPSLASVFSAYVNDGDVDALEQAYLDASGLGDDNGYAVYLGVQCTDASWPKSWATWARDNWAIHARAPYETWANAWYNEPCRHWPAASQRPVAITGNSSQSVLMVNETLDAATPYSGSLEVRSRFRGASLVAVPGGTTHSNSLNGNACVDDRIADYLLTGALPKRLAGDRADVSCAPLPKPEPDVASTRSLSPGSADVGVPEAKLQVLRESIRP